MSDEAQADAGLSKYEMQEIIDIMHDDIGRLRRSASTTCPRPAHPHRRG